MEPASHLGVHHVALVVDDIAATRAFYVDMLGFGVEREVAGEELWLTMGTDSLVFLRGDRPAVGGRLDHIGVVVAQAEDVAAWEGRLLRHGVRICEAREAYDDGSVGLICLDPCGIRVQILWHPAASRGLAGRTGR